jgi:hypothetical protein
MYRRIITVLSLLLVILIVGMVIIKSEHTRPEVKYQRWITVDSVVVKKPGEIHTLQFDNIYEIHTNDGGVFKTRRKYKVGDSIQYIYYNSKIKE